jgi:hypothetical protein
MKKTISVTIDEKLLEEFKDLIETKLRVLLNMSHETEQGLRLRLKELKSRFRFDEKPQE